MAHNPQDSGIVPYWCGFFRVLPHVREDQKRLFWYYHDERYIYEHTLL